jgi:hypothetical protein
LDATKDKLGNLRVDQSIADFRLSKFMREQPASTVTMEFETSSSRFTLRGIHPAAAQALREFASEVIDAQDGGAVWLSGPTAMHDAA